MDMVKILTKVYYDMGDTYNHILSFYEKEGVTDINAEKFIKVCEKHLILQEPSMLFKFFDFMNIFIAIFPVMKTNEWSFRIYNGKNIVILNDFIGRKEATISAIESAFNLYYKNLNKTENNGNQTKNQSQN
jgi:hypothetical protein